MAGKQGFLVVSDLHLSEGRNPGNGWIDPREDFLFDDDFSDFLEYHTESENWSGVEWTLIIAGDFVDFLQVTEMPADRPDLHREGDYGLTSGPAESAWKIRRIIQGHPALFRALAKFCTEHKIIFISGNHDAEFFFPEVRKALTGSLLELATLSTNKPAKSGHISFSPWFFFDGNIYVEHGHQYDPNNSFPSAISPLEHSDEILNGHSADNIFLPLGSIFVRYLFNRVETSSPFADNVKPESRFIGWFIRNHPVRAFLFLVTDGRKMLRKIRESRECANRVDVEDLPESYPGYPAADPVNKSDSDTGTAGESEQAQQPSQWAGEWQNLVRRLEKIQVSPLLSPPSGVPARVLLFCMRPGWIITLLTGLLLFNLLAVAILLSPLWTLMLPEDISNASLLLETVSWNRQFQIPLAAIIAQTGTWILICILITRRRRKKGCSRVLREKAALIDNILHPEYIVMGHCHEPDLVKFRSGCQYINTGTWTKIFSYESSAVREEKEFIYTRIIAEAGKRKMDLMKWEGRGGTGRRANLIDD